LNKDPPGYRPIHRYGQIVAWPILGGLHHQYCSDIVFGRDSWPEASSDAGTDNVVNFTAYLLEQSARLIEE
jgi:hypothetical protein